MGNYIKAALAKGLYIIGSYFSWIRKYSSNKKDTFPLEVRYKKMRHLISSVSKSLDIEVEAIGLENIPENGSFYLVSNHLSAYDPLAYIVAMDRPVSVVAKKEVKDYPFVGRLCSSIDCEFMDRDDLRQSLRVMMRVEKSLKEGTHNWLVFPEGTRQKDPLLPLLKFHPGTFRAPTKAKVPIIPAAIIGSERALKARKRLPKHPVTLMILKPLMPEDYANMTTDVIAEYMAKEIQKALIFKLRKMDDDKCCHFKKYQRHKII